MSGVDLGFIEPAEQPEFLLNIHFPSKVGGRPAWLNLETVPAPESLKCQSCEDQLTFLLQVYASLEKDEAFHRTIYVFVCSNEACSKENQNGNFKVFRNQILRKNPFYDFHPVPEDAEVPESKHKFKLCSVCGCRGPFNCAKCKNVSYCSKGHQRIDWKAGHKESCGQNINATSAGSSLIQLPEFEIVLEPETAQALEKDDEDPDRLEKEMEELKKFESTDQAALQNLPETELSKYANESEEDKFFSKFRKRIADEPEQILRYEREGRVLWIAEVNRLIPADVPKCENCNGERVFEFQIMPQLLNSLKSDSLDWGILAIYTCKASCGSQGEYLPEFLHKQDIVNSMEEDQE